jgi:hypothetical protein
LRCALVLPRTPASHARPADHIGAIDNVTRKLMLQLAGHGHHLIRLVDDPRAAEVSWLRRYIASVDAAASGTAIVFDLLGDQRIPRRGQRGPRRALWRRSASLT